MAQKIATRESYGNALAALGEKYDFVVLDADLAAATKTGIFKKAYPDRFFNCGIAEGNMIAVAAGVATTGTVAFASSFASTHGSVSSIYLFNLLKIAKISVKESATLRSAIFAFTNPADIVAYAPGLVSLILVDCRRNKHRPPVDL